MCRFLCYLGPPVLLADLLHRPAYSLIHQSHHARERREPLNGDGFGVGWYGPEAGSPCVFTSVTPAWSDVNLRRLAEHVRAPCFFAHVRAASPGTSVAQANCHPFQGGRYLWMHNGEVEGFARVKRRLRRSLPDRLYDAIEGTTDSEHAFALFLDALGDLEARRTPAELGRAMVGTVEALEGLRAAAGARGPSYYNFAVTDGRSLAALRYVSEPALEPISLYFAAGCRYESDPDGSGRLVPEAGAARSVFVASEPFTAGHEGWTRVPPNHVLTVGPGLDASVALVEPRPGARGE